MKPKHLMVLKSVAFADGGLLGGVPVTERACGLAEGEAPNLDRQGNCKLCQIAEIRMRVKLAVEILRTRPSCTTPDCPHDNWVDCLTQMSVRVMEDPAPNTRWEEEPAPPFSGLQPASEPFEPPEEERIPDC